MLKMRFLIQYSPVGMFADESDVSPELMMSENLESVSSVELIDTLSVDMRTEAY